MSNKQEKEIKKELEALQKETQVKTFETFREFNDLGNLSQSEPSCFNGIVRVRRYEVTVREIPEKIEVIQARIQKLWDENKNHHRDKPLRAEGKKYGMDLQ